MKPERIKAAFWLVHEARLVEIHTPPFDYSERVPYILGLQLSGVALPSSIFVIWTPDSLSISQLDGSLDLPVCVLDAIEEDVRRRGYVFPRSKKAA